MPRVTSAERLAREEGIEQGRLEEIRENIVTILRLKFGTAAKAMASKAGKLTDLQQLRVMLETIVQADSLDEVRQPSAVASRDLRLILIGPPGGGKGTQAKLLSQTHKVAHISTGDILRAAVATKTRAGKRAQPFVSSGRLVPDDLVNEMIADRLRRADRPERFIMDGYPRTLAQAEAFDGVLTEQKLPLTDVVLIDVPDEDIVERLSGRWTCPKCKATFHVTFKPPRVPGKCDECGTTLAQRDDDQEATIRKRLDVYHQSTKPLLAYYRRKKLLREVAGQGEIQAVHGRLTKVLGR